MKFSRSHDATYIDCPRKAYLEYYEGGTGFVRKGVNLEQATGGMIHRMMEGVLKIAAAEERAPLPEELDAIIEAARVEYGKEIEEKGFDRLDGSVELEIRKQQGLAEGLCRAWTKVRLPYFLQNFIVLEVEVEHDIRLSENLILMSRLDAVSRRRSDGELFAGPEFKSTGWISNDYIESWRYSSQVISHCIDVEKTYGRAAAGVLMEFLYKGVKKKDEEGNYTYYTPLLRGFRRAEGFTGEYEYGFDSALARRKGWEVVDALAVGVKEWLEVVPETILAEQLFSVEVYRSKRELDIWKRQVIIRQSLIDASLRLPERQIVLDSVFPARLDQFCYNDQYRKKCPFLEVCYGSVDDITTSDQYEARKPHHSSEFEA